MRVKIILLAFLILALNGCAFTGGERITDFENRSTIFGWLDISDVDANRLHEIVFFQYRPASDKPYYFVNFEKFEGGYLFYSHAFPKGAHKLHVVRGQQCYLLCGNTIYEYTIGKQGDTEGAVVADRAAVYFAGALKLEDVKTGWFERGKFAVSPAEKAPSQEMMLKKILETAPPEHPVIANRIERLLANAP